MNTSDFYTDLAATLHGIADDFAALAGRGLPNALVTMYVQLAAVDVPDELTVIAIDALAAALVGEPGTPQQMSSGTYHHGAYGHRDTVSIRVFDQITAPERRAAQEELARTRAEVERLRAELAAKRHAAAVEDYDSGAGWNRVAEAMDKYGCDAVLANPDLVEGPPEVTL